MNGDMESNWQLGDRVTWHYRQGGGRAQLVPGIVRTVTSSRITIDVLLKIDGEMVREKRQVGASRLTPRAQFVEGLDVE